jgi:hypothetical protein
MTDRTMNGPSLPTRRALPAFRSRHLYAMLAVVVATIEALLVLAGLATVAAVCVEGLPSSDAWITTPACAGVIVAIKIVALRHRLRTPRRTRAQRRADIAVYKQIERLLDSMRPDLHYMTCGHIVFLNNGTRWLPRLTRCVFDEDVLPQGELPGEATAEFITLSGQTPLVSRTVQMVPYRHGDDGCLVIDENLFTQVNAGVSLRQRLVAIRLAESTGLLWMSSEDKHELAEQLKDAVPVVGSPT